MTQFAAHRFFASEVNTADRPSPYCQRTNSGSVSVGIEDRVRRGPRRETHIAAQRGGGLHSDAVQNLRLLHDLGLNRFLHGGVAGVLFDVAEQQLFEPRRIVEEIGFALGRRWPPSPGTRD